MQNFFFQEIPQKYGEIVKGCWFGRRYILISSPDLMEVCLRAVTLINNAIMKRQF